MGDSLGLHIVCCSYLVNVDPRQPLACVPSGFPPLRRRRDWEDFVQESEAGGQGECGELHNHQCSGPQEFGFLRLWPWIWGLGMGFWMFFVSVFGLQPVWELPLVVKASLSGSRHLASQYLRV